MNIFHKCLCFLAIVAFGSQKTRIKELFQELGDEDMNVHPQLIRMAFHDAAHFDSHEGQYRMGCFVEIMENAIDCPAHDHMDEAIALRNSIFDQLVSEGFNPSHADLTQLLGALAVDRLSLGTAFDQSLYDHMRMGRIDIDNCEDVCENLPDFAVSSATTIHERLSSVWTFSFVNKMMENMGFSNVEAVALLGAHTVGRVRGQFSCAGCNGPWTDNPFVFDNSYYQELQNTAQSLESCSDDSFMEQTNTNFQIFSCLSPFGKVFPTWFQEITNRFVNWVDHMALASGELTELPQENGPASGNDVLNLLMTDADMALFFNEPELVKSFADDANLWRSSFNNAYVKMSELGCGEEISGFQLVDDLDVESADPIPISIDIPCPVAMCMNIGVCPAGTSVGTPPPCGQECCIGCPCCVNEDSGACVPSCPNNFLISVCPNGHATDSNGCPIDVCAPLVFDYIPLGDGNNGFCRDDNGDMQMLQDFDLDTEAECKALCDSLFACAGYQYGREGRSKDCNLYSAAETISSHTNTFHSCQQKQDQLSLDGYAWRGAGFCRRDDGLKFHLEASTENSEWDCKTRCDQTEFCAGFTFGTNHDSTKCNLYSEAGSVSSFRSMGGCWEKM